MKPVDMSRAGRDDGDCLMACVASILECELDSLPVISALNESEWFSIVLHVFRDRGFYLLGLADEGSDPTDGSQIPSLSPQGYTIAIGPAGRSSIIAGQTHAVVALDGNVVHDPHPTRTGIERVDFWLIPIPVLRTERVVHPVSTQDDAGAVL